MSQYKNAYYIDHTKHKRGRGGIRSTCGLLRTKTIASPIQAPRKSSSGSKNAQYQGLMPLMSCTLLNNPCESLKLKSQTLFKPSTSNENGPNQYRGHRAMTDETKAMSTSVKVKEPKHDYLKQSSAYEEHLKKLKRKSNVAPKPEAAKKVKESSKEIKIEFNSECIVGSVAGDQPKSSEKQHEIELDSKPVDKKVHQSDYKCLSRATKTETSSKSPIEGDISQDAIAIKHEAGLPQQSSVVKSVNKANVATENSDKFSVKQPGPLKYEKGSTALKKHPNKRAESASGKDPNPLLEIDTKTDQNTGLMDAYTEHMKKLKKTIKKCVSNEQPKKTSPNPSHQKKPCDNVSSLSKGSSSKENLAKPSVDASSNAAGKVTKTSNTKEKPLIPKVTMTTSSSKITPSRPLIKTAESQSSTSSRASQEAVRPKPLKTKSSQSSNKKYSILVASRGPSFVKVPNKSPVQTSLYSNVPESTIKPSSIADLAKSIASQVNSSSKRNHNLTSCIPTDVPNAQANKGPNLKKLKMQSNEIRHPLHEKRYSAESDLSEPYCETARKGKTPGQSVTTVYQRPLSYGKVFDDGFITIDSTDSSDMPSLDEMSTRRAPVASDFFYDSGEISTNTSHNFKPTFRGILKYSKSDSHEKNKSIRRSVPNSRPTKIRPELRVDTASITVVSSAHRSREETLANMSIDNAIAAGLQYLQPVSGYHCTLCSAFYHDYPTALHHCTQLNHKMKVLKELGTKSDSGEKLHAKTFQSVAGTTLLCQWCECNFATGNSHDLVRHLYFHGFHTKTVDIPDKYYDHVRDHATLSDPEKLSSGKLGFKCHWEGCNYEYVAKEGKSHLGRHKLVGHMTRHTQERIYACPWCGNLYTNKTKLIDHFARQISAEDHNFQCTHCSRTFASERILKDHMRHHVNHYQCPKCAMTCPNPSALRHHIRYKHSSKRPYACEFCDYRSKEPHDMQKHMDLHQTDLTFHCQVAGCEYEVRSLQNLRYHYRSKHGPGDGKYYACHLCKKKCSTGYLLTHHLRRIHSFQWPPGHCRFRYKECEDGFYRLQVFRYESIEMTKQISLKDIGDDIDGDNGQENAPSTSTMGQSSEAVSKAPTAKNRLKSTRKKNSTVHNLRSARTKSETGLKRKLRATRKSTCNTANRKTIEVQDSNVANDVVLDVSDPLYVPSNSAKEPDTHFDMRMTQIESNVEIAPSLRSWLSTGDVQSAENEICDTFNGPTTVNAEIPPYASPLQEIGNNEDTDESSSKTCLGCSSVSCPALLQDRSPGFEHNESGAVEISNVEEVVTHSEESLSRFLDQAYDDISSQDSEHSQTIVARPCENNQEMNILDRLLGAEQVISSNDDGVSSRLSPPKRRFARAKKRLKMSSDGCGTSIEANAQLPSPVQDCPITLHPCCPPVLPNHNGLDDMPRGKITTESQGMTALAKVTSDILTGSSGAMVSVNLPVHDGNKPIDYSATLCNGKTQAHANSNGANPYAEESQKRLSVNGKQITLNRIEDTEPVTIQGEDHFLVSGTDEAGNPVFCLVKGSGLEDVG